MDRQYSQNQAGMASAMASGPVNSKPVAFLQSHEARLAMLRERIKNTRDRAECICTRAFGAVNRISPPMDNAITGKLEVSGKTQSLAALAEELDHEITLLNDVLNQLEMLI